MIRLCLLLILFSVYGDCQSSHIQFDDKSEQLIIHLEKWPQADMAKISEQG